MVVHQTRRLGKSTRVIVEHPEGGLLSLPASETSLELSKPSLVAGGVPPLFDPEKLLRLVEWVGAKAIATTAEIASCQQHLGVDMRKIDATTAHTPRRPDKRRRRPHAALNQSDSTVSGQNARRPTTTAQQPTKESN